MLSRAARDGHEVRLFVPVEGDWADLERQVVEFQPEVVGISVLSKHADIATDLGRRIRHRLPPHLLVAGGSHPTGAAFDLLGDFDVCVIGEGEETFAALLLATEARRELSTVAGISYIAPNGEPQFTGARPRITDLNGLPWPLREPRLHRAEALGICFLPSSTVRFASLLYARGCPFSCKFCCSPQHWGHQVMFRSPEGVIAELAYLRDAFGVNYVSFADLTFTVNRKRVVELCEQLIAANLGVHWMCETSIDTVDRRLLHLMAAAGCTKICWGVETGDDASLEAIGKRHALGQASEVLQWAHDEGIFNWAFTMIGFPWQSELDVLAATAKLEYLPIHQLRVSIATPFKGTPWSSSFPPTCESHSSRFDTNNLVYRHASISPARMKDLQALCLRKFYQSPHYRHRMASMASRFPRLRQSIKEFLDRISGWLATSQAASPLNGGIAQSRDAAGSAQSLPSSPTAARCSHAETLPDPYLDRKTAARVLARGYRP